MEPAPILWIRSCMITVSNLGVWVLSILIFASPRCCCLGRPIFQLSGWKSYQQRNCEGPWCKWSSGVYESVAYVYQTSARSDASYKHLNEFKGKMESWCDEHDTYCSPTPPVDGSVHTSYFQQDHYISQSVDFVKHLGHGKGGKGTGGQGEKTDKTQ